jgi:hypothetical protein
MTTGNGDLVSLPVDVPVLNPQHLAAATTGLQGADDAVVHRGKDVRVFGSPHLAGCREQRLFLVQSDTTIALRLLLGFDRYSESDRHERAPQEECPRPAPSTIPILQQNGPFRV